MIVLVVRSTVCFPYLDESQKRLGYRFTKAGIYC